jgi:DNA-binding HxlR family transcriptional regulator
MDSLGLEEVGLLKWSMPILRTLGGGAARYRELRRALPGITDRALTMGLRDLRGADLIRRRVLGGTPPTVEYETSRRAEGLLRHLRSL